MFGQYFKDDVIDSLEYPNLSTKSISYLQSELLNKLFQNAMGAYGKVSEIVMEFDRYKGWHCSFFTLKLTLSLIFM